MLIAQDPLAVLERARYGAAIADLGPLAGQPYLVIDLDRDGPALAQRQSSPVPDGLPAVVIGVSRAETLPPAPRLDVLLCAQQRPPRPWVGVPAGEAGGLDAVLAQLVGQITAAPGPSATFAQLLRMSDGLSIGQALIAESLVYSTLQSGADFERWLQTRRGSTPVADAEPVVLTERCGDTLTVTLNRPARRNAFNAAMRDSLVEALLVAADDPGLDQIELRGAGENFCSGGDLAEFGTRSDTAFSHLVRTSQSAGLVLSQLAERTTAYLHGWCIGAGIELPAYVHRVVASPDTRAFLPEVALGLIPGAGGTVSLPRRIGRERTLWMGLSGSTVDAPTGLDWGLWDAVTDM
ncbi:MAG: Enoyl-CoA hydratase/isomerase [Frankiales bacterium]|nr:Enoyl-CoA hydratase/isomerase [Frankiales bacterium]